MATKQKIFIPTYISSVDYAPARVQPRILFYNGPKECETYYVRSGSVANEFSSFPYFDNYSGQNTTTESLSLLFNNELAPYGETPTSSLYTEYWENYINLLYNPRTRLVNASAIIPLADYFKMELNGIAQFRGNYYHIRAINDYNLTTGECNIQLLGPVLEGSLNLDVDFNCDFSYTSSIVTTTTAPPTTTTTTTVDPTSVLQYLVIGAGGNGGGGADGANGGGGGAGGFVSGSSLITDDYSYTITVGTASLFGGLDTKGGDSQFDGVFAIGGGNGGGDGANGGSGGGGRGKVSSPYSVGGAGIPGQGNNGGRGSIDSVAGNRAAGGGGGASEVGADALGQLGGDIPGKGGDGKQWLDGIYYSGGGAGARQDGSYIQNGGLGGGGATLVTGSMYKGGGGGAGRIGGAGVVIARYLGGQQANGGTITSAGGYTYHTFTSSGQLTFGNPPITTTTTTASPLVYYNVLSNFSEFPIPDQTAFTYVDFNDNLRSVVIDVPPISNSYNFVAKAGTVVFNSVAGVSNSITNITNSTTYKVPPVFRNYNIKSTGSGLTKISYQSSNGNTIQYTSSDAFDFNVCAVENSIVQSYNARATISVIPGGC